MADFGRIVDEMRAGKQIRFADLFKVCTHYFGTPRNPGSSHFIFKMPWPGDPRVNIQNEGGKAKPYQVRQVLAAIDKLTKPTTPTTDERKTEEKSAGKTKPSTVNKEEKKKP